MSPYASHTEVPVERSKTELERLLLKAGAKQYGTAHDEEGGIAHVHFRLVDRHIRLQVPLPRLDSFPDPTKPNYMNKAKTHAQWSRWTVERRRAWVRERYEQECRVRWRGLILICKAKLELIGHGLSTIDREFLADIVLPDGRSVGEFLEPAITRGYANGTMPRLLLPEHEGS